MSPEQKDAHATFDLALKKTMDAFDKAADSMSDSDAKFMLSAEKALSEHGDALYTLFGGIEKPDWSDWYYWYAFRMINEIDVNFH